MFSWSNYGRNEKKAHLLDISLGLPIALVIDWNDFWSLYNHISFDKKMSFFEITASRYIEKRIQENVSMDTF